VHIYNPDGLVFNKTKESIISLFGQNDYILTDTKVISEEFLKNEVELEFIDCRQTTDDTSIKTIMDEYELLQTHTSCNFGLFLTSTVVAAGLTSHKLK
jgi:hypothetical protein